MPTMPGNKLLNCDWKIIEGEGLRGLSTAFLFAGARNVVASLWKVADESTSLLMVDFYSQLLSWKDKANALRTAKLNLMKDPRFNHPYYWSAFIQIGEN
jgi:CHAT domain-containing protein